MIKIFYKGQHHSSEMCFSEVSLRKLLLVQVIAWCWLGNKASPEPVMTKIFLDYITYMYMVSQSHNEHMNN